MPEILDLLPGVDETRQVCLAESREQTDQSDYIGGVITTETRTALVTGATSGIGRAAAKKLARDGFKVLVHGRDTDRGAAVVKAIEGLGGRAEFLAADLTDVAAIKQLADTAKDVEVLVNNAGFSWFGPTADLEPDIFDALFDANVRSAYYLTAAIALG